MNSMGRALAQLCDTASGTNYPIAQAGALVVLTNATGVSQLYYSYGDGEDILHVNLPSKTP